MLSSSEDVRDAVRVYTMTDNGMIVPVSLSKEPLSALNNPTISHNDMRNTYPISTNLHLEQREPVLHSCGGDLLVARNREHHLNKTYVSQTARSNGSHRIKRQAPRSYNVETLVVGDYALYERFLTLNGNDVQKTLTSMTDWYANVFKSVRRRYESTVRPSFAVTVTASSFLFLMSPANSPWTENNKVGNDVRSRAALMAFNDFAAAVNQQFRVDHATLITGYQLKSDDLRRSVLGLAYTFGMCSSDSSSLVQESFNEQTANTIAHEIGHSLGSRHDGDGNTCSSSDFFLMAPSSALPETLDKASNPWTFSSCSVDAMDAFLATSDGACTLTTTAVVTLDLSQYTVTEYGQRRDADTQCRFSYGLLSKFCREQYLSGTGVTFDDMCYDMRCFSPLSNQCFNIPAADGTSCGNGKWCFKGRCEINSQAPARLGNCPQLDDPMRSCSLASCADPLAILIYCCSTCAQVAPSFPPPSLSPSTGPQIELFQGLDTLYDKTWSD